MGYVIELIESDVHMDAEKCPAALECLKLVSDPTHPIGQSKGAGSFKWVHFDHTEWRNIEEAMEDWRLPVTLDERGDIVDIEFKGEKYGEEKLVLDTIAPMLRDGSFLKFRGEDREEWLYVVKGTTVETKELNYC